jgi:hypothetical protein
MPLIGAKAYRPVISEVRTIARSGSALPSETVDRALRPIAMRPRVNGASASLRDGARHA